jgi:hypothetical protein
MNAVVWMAASFTSYEAGFSHESTNGKRQDEAPPTDGIA